MLRPHRRLRLVARVGLTALLAAPALAADGVLEINQACATTTGCFTDDKGGFPVTITDSAPARSFRLTSDLVVPTANDTAIRVLSSRVVIDLGGFAVRGPVTCAGTPLVCSASGTGDGITVDSTARDAVEVRHGAVSGMGRTGVSVGTRGVVEGIRADQNAGNGIQAGEAALVRGCNAMANGGRGISTSFGGQVLESVAEKNGSTGIDSLGSAVVMANASRKNGGAGINVSATSVVKDNVCVANEGSGISSGFGSTIADNVVQSNGLEGIGCLSRCNISGNVTNGNGTESASGDGIECGAFCAIRANTVSSAQSFGLNLGANSAYRENVIEATGGGTVNGGVNRGENHCGGVGAVTSTCP